ncbi:FHA domain-containing protein [Bifidobacterium sp. MA2]|uniref:FHA domain-containing protein n=1 Tax=Bifidobacterium santillanense TaxID=2809028 RepID=A0ABS5UPH9_9BIFI|nr:FHA domain-containing protein [Bifidobacterium santillanense]MBT1172836.1 FHA domain-containing protein [Bifidobacterium santillanense]
MTRTIPFPPAPEPGWYADDALPAPGAGPARELMDDIQSVADEPFDAEALDGAGDGLPAALSAIEDVDDEYPATSAAIPMHTVPMTQHAGGDSGLAELSRATGDVLRTLPRHQEPADAASGESSGEPAPGSSPASSAAGPAAVPAVSPAGGPTPASSDASPRRTYVLRNGSTGQSIVVDSSMLLGRRPSNPVPDGARIVQLEDPTRTISRNHATITMDEDGRLWLDDCRSLNGTFLVIDGHDHKIASGEAVAVAAPASIRFGDQLFELTERTSED